MADRSILLDLASRCESEHPISDNLKLEIFVALDGHLERLRDTMKPPGFDNLSNCIAITKWLLIRLSEIAGDGMCFCEFGSPAPGKSSFAGVGVASSLEGATLAAALRARAYDLAYPDDPISIQ